MIRDQATLNILLVSEYAAERFCRNVRLSTFTKVRLEFSNWLLPAI